jgi:riboflavin synthase
VRLLVDSGRLGLRDVSVGDSITVNGACLTVVKRGKKSFSVDVSRETLRVTAGLDREGDVNLEKALRLSDKLDGHLVLGHVDGVGKVMKAERIGASRLLRVRAPASLARYIARKGSIAVDGVSLTVNAVRGAEFEVNLIPHTLAVTTLKALSAGDRVNLEVDPLARYAERLLRR